MPAIHPERLKQEAAELALHLNQTSQFLRSLDDFLDRYADRIRRSGQSGKPGPLLPAYQVAPPVLRQILAALAPRLAGHPAQTFALADGLWEKRTLETRLLAARLLGLAPADPPDPILARARAWMRDNDEEQILAELWNEGLAALLERHPKAAFEMIQDGLVSKDLREKRTALRSLFCLAQNPRFENLPLLFKLLQAHVREAPPGLGADFLEILQRLAARSPAETAYFLNQLVIEPHTPTAAWVVRQTRKFLTNPV